MTGISGFTVVLMPSLALFAGLQLSGIGLDRAFGFAGGVLAIGTFGVTQYQSRRPPTRRIVFLAKSRSSFARNIYRGLVEGLAPYGDIHVSGAFPEHDDDPRAFQIDRLRSLEIARADGLVIIPATDDTDVWQSLARSMRRGTTVVCLDTKPPNQHFLQYGTLAPHFVGSDFSVGGRIVGRYLIERLEQSPDAQLLVALGPSSSWPARERSSWILYEVAAAGLLSRCHVVELPDWTPTIGAARLLATIEGVADGCGALYVFAGNDKLAVELDRQLDRSSRTPTGVEVRLVGYDGTTTDDGEHVLVARDRAIATIDALPLAQGKAAAEFIEWAYEGQPIDVRKRIVDPRLIQFDGVASSVALLSE